MHMPQPSPGHELLKELAGDWEGEEKMYPSQWDPAGGTARGKYSSRLDLNGFALIDDYAQERDGKVTFTGHGVWTFDPKAELYSLHWFDCMGSPAEHFTGRLEDGILVMAHGGPGMHARMTYDLSEAGRIRSKMEMSPDGADWKTLFEGDYRRK